MPSIIPSWIYTLFAALVVGAILVASCSLATVHVKNEAQNQQLVNIEQYVAAKCLTLLTQTTQEDQSTTQFLNLPSQVGNQIYWICIANDSSGTWVASGFGKTASLTHPGIYLPANVAASGIFISSYGRPYLICDTVNQTLTLQLSSD